MAGNGIATLLLAVNPRAVGFRIGGTIWVSGFQAGDRAFNVGRFRQGVGIVDGATILAVTSTAIVYAAPGTSGATTTPGTVLQMGNAVIPPAGLVAVYSDPELTDPERQPISTDGLGNWNGFVPQGIYYVQFYSRAIVTTLRLASVGGAGGAATAGEIGIGHVTTLAPVNNTTLAKAWVEVDPSSTPAYTILNFGIPAGLPGSGPGPGPGPAQLNQALFSPASYRTDSITPVSAGIGESFTSATQTSVEVSLLVPSSGMGTVYLYRSTESVPPSDSAVPAGDTLVAYATNNSSRFGTLTAATYDQVVPGTDYHYYLAMRSSGGRKIAMIASSGSYERAAVSEVTVLNQTEIIPVGYSTTSVTPVSTGAGGSFSSAGQTSVQVSFLLSFNGQGSVYVYRSGTSIPPADAPVGSDTLVAYATNTSDSFNSLSAVSYDQVTAGSTYQYYLAIRSSAGAPVSINAAGGAYDRVFITEIAG